MKLFSRVSEVLLSQQLPKRISNVSANRLKSRIEYFIQKSVSPVVLHVAQIAWSGHLNSWIRTKTD